MASKPKDWKLTPNGTGETYLGQDLKEDTRGFYIIINNTEASIFTPPRGVSIEHFSIQDYHEIISTNGNHRQIGVYTLGGATAICKTTHTTGGNTPATTRLHQPITVSGHCWEDVQELVMRIKAGTILPKIPHDEPQIKPLPVQFYDWLVMGVKIIKRDVLRFKGIY